MQRMSQQQPVPASLWAHVKETERALNYAVHGGLQRPGTISTVHSRRLSGSKSTDKSWEALLAVIQLGRNFNLLGLRMTLSIDTETREVRVETDGIISQRVKNRFAIEKREDLWQKQEERRKAAEALKVQR